MPRCAHCWRIWPWRRGPHPRAELATLLWPEQSERTARASLSQALTTLRNALGDTTAAATGAAQRCPERSAGSGRRAGGGCDAVPRLAAGRRRHTRIAAGAPAPPALSACARRSSLYRGNFLADLPIPDSAVFEEWAMPQREHLLQRALSTLERLVERAQWRGALHRSAGLCPPAGCAGTAARSESARLYALAGAERRDGRGAGAVPAAQRHAGRGAGG